jgi:hypothetical protein
MDFTRDQAKEGILNRLNIVQVVGPLCDAQAGRSQHEGVVTLSQ